MIRRLAPEAWKQRSRSIRRVRTFFEDRGFLEVETPILNPWATTEPFLYPFEVLQEAGKGHATLITSPEFNLKVLWADLRCNLFEIAHCFRGRESGPLHTSEFLMLEWYATETDEQNSIQLIHALIACLLENQESRSAQDVIPQLQVFRMEELFQSILGLSLDFETIRIYCLKRGHFAHDAPDAKRRYEEYFFTLFLNYVEPSLNSEHIVAIYDYPEELAAYARIENGRARRFEVYWKGLELANGYVEVCDAREQRKRMQSEATVKDALLAEEGRKARQPMDEQLLEVMEESPLPDGCGVALGLDRLLMAIQGADSIDQISPFQ
ncbi:MAG: elongation factor P--(R)-beta-lysine ligase [Leptospiraceae bacterium]|nr:elongation factor P--(R)-beta-lysine ligase [Leptospiraceae bacterium]